jgi:hypothetical protein
MRPRWTMAGMFAAAAAVGGIAVAAGPAGSAPNATTAHVQAAGKTSHRVLAGTVDRDVRAKATDTQLVIGTVLRNVPMDVTPGMTKGYRKIYVYGHLQHCVWLKPGVHTKAKPGAAHHNCATFNFFDVHDYARRVNCLPLGRSKAYLEKHYPQSARCTDGSPARINLAQAGCGGTASAYANIQPWHSKARPADLYGTLPNGTSLKWRYIARDTNWVLVHAAPLHPGQSHWYFVRRACVSAPSVHNPKGPYHPLHP